MNTQNQKVLAIAAVVALHVGAITLMLAQHGCKSGAQKSPAPAAAAPAPAPTPAPVVVADSESGFTSPTAPAPETVVAPLPVPMAQFSEPLGSISSTPAPTPAAAPMTVTWKVAKGDTLSSIAKKNGVTVDELIAANAPKVTRTSPLSLNQVINIPTHASATAAPAPAAAADPNARTYKVVAGDTLSKVASKNGTTVKALKEANGLTSDGIREGEILKLPASAGGASASTATAATPTAVADTSGATYQVKSGDTLGKIAAKVGVKTAELMAANGFTETSAKNLKPGQMLKLPATAHAPDASAPAPAAMTPTMVTPTTIISPAPVTVTAVPVTATGTTPPVTPINP
jgi:LysM repeat protein